MSPPPRLLAPEVKRAREARILHVAESMMLAQGINGLTMDKVVAQVPFSKGTVYGHFACKEDLCVELCLQKCTRLVELFEQASEVPLRPCHKLLLLNMCHLLYALLDPLAFELSASVKAMPATYQRVCSQRISRLLSSEQAVLKPVLSVLNQALLAKELRLPSTLSSHQACFLLWSSNMGVITLLRNAKGLPGLLGQLRLGEELLNLNGVLLDGLRGPSAPPTLRLPSSIMIEQLRTFFPALVGRLAERGLALEMIFSPTDAH